MKRQQERDQAFLFIFENEFHESGFDEIIEAKKLSEDIKISKFAEKIFCGIEEHKSEIESLIEKNIIGWSKERLSKVAVSIFKVAIYEMIFEEKIPVSVSINEAVELAKKYGTEKDAIFINGVLGTIARQRV
jgi:N utilization substance protein B